MARLDFDEVSKVYDDSSGTVLAVDKADFTIQDGEFFVLVGPSGCGKSTLLRMIAGLETITEGQISIGGEVVNDKPPKDRPVAMVFQNYALYPHKTVRGNMAYGLKLSTDLSEEEINAQVEETAEMMEIEDLLDKKPAALSGGQRQRVATGRAIVRHPEVYLFDEPLSNLDAKLRKHLRTELKRIHSELGTTAIYVTHNQEEAMTMSDRIAVIDNGRIQQIGTPKQIYFEPANYFVADFIGEPSMNFLDVEFTTTNRGGHLEIEDSLSYELSEEFTRMLQDVSDEDEFILGIRPDDLMIGDETSNMSAEKTMPLTVDLVEVLGSENIVYFDLDGQEIRSVTSELLEPERGTTLDVSFHEEDIHIFDVNSEEALMHGIETVEERTPRQQTANS